MIGMHLIFYVWNNIWHVRELLQQFRNLTISLNRARMVKNSYEIHISVLCAEKIFYETKMA